MHSAFELGTIVYDHCTILSMAVNGWFDGNEVRNARYDRRRCTDYGRITQIL